MKQCSTIKLVIFFLLLLECTAAISQVTVQVVRKKYEEKVDASRIKTLAISAEKADIKVMPATTNEISFEVEVATKHPEKKQVIEDYKKMKFLWEVSGQTLYLRSYLLLEKDEPKPKANFEVTYVVYLPKNVALTIKNTFGNVTVEGTSAALEASLKFCNTVISKSASTCNLTADYGTLKMINLANDVEIIARHTTMELDDIGGELKIDSNYGKITLRPGEKPKSITLKGNKTEVEVEITSKPTFGIRIAAKDTELNLPDFIKSTKSQDSKSHFSYQSSAVSRIELDTYLGSIHIK